MPNINELKAEINDLRTEARILTKRCEKEEVAEADLEALNETVAAIEAKQLELKAAEDRAEMIRKAREFATDDSVTDPPNVPQAPVVQVKPRFEDDPQGGFKTPREFFAAVQQMAMPGASLDDDRLKMLAAVGSDEHRGNSNPLGGFAIPDAFSPNLLTVGADGDPSVNLVTSVPMTAPVVKIPARVDKTHTTSVTGGFRFYRRNEAETVTASNTTLERVELNVSDLMGISFATGELMTDSPISIAAIISSGFGEEYGSHMLGEKLRGTGVGELEGILNSPALVSVAKTTSQTADTISGTNIIAMRARAWGYGNAIWMANPDTYPQLVSAHISGTNGDIFLFRPGNGVDVPDTLLGRPIFFNEHVSTVGDLGDLILANWSQYLYGEYQRLESASSIHVRFVYNESAFRVTARNDGKCWWRSALTPKKGSNTLSPFVALAERA